MAEPIITTLDQGTFTVTLNNPAKHNCMGLEMLNELNDAVQYAQQEEAVNVVVIRGAGDRSFSTGANLKEFNALEGKEIEQWILLGHEIFGRLESLPKPTIAFINGYAMGGGLELALSCDFRLATAESILSFPEVKNGWLPGWGGIPKLCRLMGETHAKRIILMSEQISAEEAYNLGLVTKVLKDPERDLSLFVEALLGVDSDAYRLGKSAIHQLTRHARIDPSFDVLATYFAKKQ